MARCCGGATCSCVIASGETTTVTGIGTAADPYVVEAVDLDISGQELAAAYVTYSFNTAFAVSPAAANAIIGAQIIVPPTTGPVMIYYGTDATVGTSGGGSLQLQLYNDPAFTVAQYTSEGVVAAQITSVSGALLPIRGEYRIEGSTSDRTFFLAVQLFRDGGSSLTANAPSTPNNPSFIRAVAL